MHALAPAQRNASAVGSNRLQRDQSVCSAAREERGLYDVLNVQPGASAAEIKAQYRRLAHRYHPDVNKSETAQDRFRAIHAAYQVLTDDQLRPLYDAAGLAALGAKWAHLGRHVAPGAGRGERGADVSTVIGLEFSESVTGAEKAVTVSALGRCPECHGSGLPAGAAGLACDVCRGSGEILRSRWLPHSPKMTFPGTCPACGGAGVATPASCTRCSGEGRTRTQRTVRLRVPAGVQHRQVLRVKSQGDAGRFGGPPGDLLLKLEVSDLDSVKREGDDLVSELQLSLCDALLGAAVSVATMRGRRLLEVPPGTQHGARLRVANAGVPRARLGVVSYGHHFFDVRITVPKLEAPTAERALVEQLRRLLRP